MVRLRSRLILISVLPVIVMGVAGIFAIFNMLRTQREHMEDISRQSAVSAATHLDALFGNVMRAADELAHNRESLEMAVATAQENQLSDFFHSYFSALDLKVMVSGPDQKAVYRSWDPLNTSPEIPAEHTGLFGPKIIMIDGKPHFAVSYEVTSRIGKVFGQEMVATEMNPNLLSMLSASQVDAISIGQNSEVLTATGARQEHSIKGRATSAVIPSIWVEVHNDSSKVIRDTTRAILAMSVLFALVAIVTGYYLWTSVEAHILGPIKKIYSVIIENQNATVLERLPKNELGELGTRLSAQKADIEQKNILLKSMSDEFKREASLLKVLSHDISTPLAVVRMSFDLLKTDQDAAARVKTLQRALSNVSTIEEILSHVKDMKALESGKRTLALREIKFGPIIQDVAMTFKDRLEAKGITLEWIPADESAVFVADQISFKVSVLSNLISNAIKFSSRGGRIFVRCREVDGLTRVEVRDYGAGIPVNIRDHLFSTNHATTRKGSEGESGTGFGMPLVKFYVGLYGGSIDFQTKTKEESPTDHGTQFNVVLPSRLSGVKSEAA